LPEAPAAPAEAGKHSHLPVLDSHSKPVTQPWKEQSPGAHWLSSPQVYPAAQSLGFLQETSTVSPDA
jgi:hypothetical protein